MATIANAAINARRLNAAFTIRMAAKEVLESMGSLGKTVFKDACSGYTSIMVRDLTGHESKKAEKQAESLPLLINAGFVLSRIAGADSWLRLDWSVSETGKAKASSACGVAQTLSSMAPTLFAIKESYKDLRKFGNLIFKSALSGNQTAHTRDDGSDKWSQNKKLAITAGFKVKAVRGTVNEYLIKWDSSGAAVPFAMPTLDEEDEDDDEEEEDDDDDDDEEM